MRVRASDDDLGVIAHNDPHDRGDLRLFTTTIHTGGRFDSALLVPVIGAQVSHNGGSASSLR